MGRPRELTEEQRQELLSWGYRPVEMWILDWENPHVIERVKLECEAINASDARSGELEFLEEVTSDLWDDLAE